MFSLLVFQTHNEARYNSNKIILYHKFGEKTVNIRKWTLFNY